MFLHVKEVEHIEGHKLRLSFSDGSSGEVDLVDELKGQVFEPLQNVAKFRNVMVAGHTVAWDNGADFAPEFLRDLMQEQGTVLTSSGVQVER